ncbi:MAG TPA: methylmalonyl Co-A mutase-associated GTPase MeaB [Candidatus Kapabacteria bacterium]|nr:methylmalonyl Co-A mutase-associated GTPase MeaB [Candidatus Kapabacteria bacterium]
MENKISKSNSRSKFRKAILTVDDYYNGIISGNRAILSQAITLIESKSQQDEQIAQELITRILPLSGKSIRIGISGSPGVGKSTFVESFGNFLINQGKKVAVLAIDPSSRRTHGSILGDKIRMENLSRNQSAFIRPSPSGDVAGGVSRKTRETILLCEAAGYDIILIETVGVGQNEVEVRSMVDFFLVLLLPNEGDELQGIKKGIIELADAIVINKSDGDQAAIAERTRKEYQMALHILSPKDKKWTPKVLTCSALYSQGIDEIWNTIKDYFNYAKENGIFDKNRKEQLLEWFDNLLKETILDAYFRDKEFREKIEKQKEKIANQEISPVNAVREIL